MSGTPPRFFADAMLGRLARYLRFLGYDTSYRADVEDADLVAEAAREGRVVLTRDRALVLERRVRPALLLTSDDLLKNVFDSFNAHLKRIEIVKLQNDIFYGNIVAEADGREIHGDSRPSDAIALSVRAHVPILVHRSVMDEAGILPEESMPEGGEAPGKTEPAPLSKEGVERLSVFEDFLGKLDLDRLDDKDKPDNDSPSDQPKKPKKK